jgi:hypothetical protein
MYQYKSVCTNCGHTQEGTDLGFWSLNNYYGIRGRFCGPCYNKVSHDSYGNPEHPGEYIAILLKQKETA